MDKMRYVYIQNNYDNIMNVSQDRQNHDTISSWNVSDTKLLKLKWHLDTFYMAAIQITMLRQSRSIKQI